MSALLPAYEKLQRRASITSSARFNASVRIQKRASLSIWAISLASVYLLMLSLVPLILPKIGEGYSAHINAINACLSLIVLVTSIIEGMRDHGKIAHLYHEAGLRIREIQNAVAISMADGNLSAVELRTFQADYDRVLKEIGVNHLEIDVLQAEIAKGIARDSSQERPLGVLEDIGRRLSYFRLWLTQFTLYWLCIVGPPVIVLLLFCFSGSQGWHQRV
jgi:hypothetical protein